MMSTAESGLPPTGTPDTGLFKESYERDSCGFGLIANLDDQPSRWLVDTALVSLNRLTHRGAVATQSFGGGPPDAAGGTCHDGDLAGVRFERVGVLRSG